MASVWLTHHPPSEHGRCAHVGPLLVCRRCLALWPLTWGLLVLQVVLRAPAFHPADWLLPLFLLPPVVEYVAVHLEAWEYRPRRTTWLAMLMGIGLGRLFYRYVVDPFDDATLTALAAVALPCAWAAWHHATTRDAVPPDDAGEP